MLLLYAAHFCLSEVHNGGFLQLFWNSTGIRKWRIPEASGELQSHIELLIHRY